MRVGRGWRHWWRRGDGDPRPAVSPIARDLPVAEISTLVLDPGDPLVTHIQRQPGVVEVAKLSLDSPVLRHMRAANVELVVPLVSQGEVIGLLTLGPRRGRQSYSAADRAFLTSLASQVAPAVRVAQLVDQQQMEAQARERIEQELRVAQLIQQTLLPQATPDLPGWRLETVYRPARTVGGDFYDFIRLENGRWGVVIADATSKGVPAALVMATTRSVLRATASQRDGPGQVLGRANELLCPDMPPNMFVTCLYAVLDPVTGVLAFANAGHPLPLHQHDGGVSEIRVTGVPLGLMPDASYEEREIVLSPGENILFYSDGLVEARGQQREMFGIPRLRQMMADHGGDERTLIDHLLDHLAKFTGTDDDLEDDVTLVTLQRLASDESRQGFAASTEGDQWRVLAEWEVTSELGNERLAIDRVAAVIGTLDVPPRRLERLKTAVGEATLNAIEHGNHYDPELPVRIQVRVSETAVSIRITDQGSGPPTDTPIVPDLEAKLAADQSPRGWGLFLIEHMVDEVHVTGNGARHTDEVRVTSDGSHHTVELVLRLGGDDGADQHA